MVRIEDLTFGYKKKRLLFNNLNIELYPGKVYGLFGRNGAGKTTLLKHIAGLLFPHKGSCMVFEYSSKSRKPEVLSNIFLIPEEFELPSISIKKFLSINSPFYPNFDSLQMERYLEEFEINNDNKLTTMSYGQKKKFLIAFGLSTNSRLLLMDEPTNGLDIPSKSQFRKIIASSSNEERCIIVSTHQVRDLGTIIDQITILDEGRIIFDHNLEAISNAFIFKKVKDDKEHEIVYSEDILGGKAAICRNKGESSEIDMELLFNGIINDTEKINIELKKS